MVPENGLLLLLTFTVAVSACGRKGPVRAPEDVLPQRITDLTVATARDGIQLSWSRPRTYTDGSRMTDLGGFIVERAGAAPQAGFQKLATQEVSDRDRFRQVKHFTYLDRDTTVGTVYRYRVVSFTVDGYFSEASNVVMAQRREPDEEKDASLPPTPR
jgi:hypothetical protein